MSNKEVLSNKFQLILSRLPEDKVLELNEFAEFLTVKYEESVIRDGIQKIVSESDTFKFQYTEEDLYSTTDLKEVY
jgi:hypothetical protein